MKFYTTDMVYICLRGWIGLRIGGLQPTVIAKIFLPPNSQFSSLWGNTLSKRGVNSKSVFVFFRMMLKLLIPLKLA